MGHYTIRTNDDEDQVIRKAQEATGMASASKAFMTAILELQRNRDEITQLRRSLAQEKARSQELVSSVNHGGWRRFSLKNRDYLPSRELRFHVAHAVSDAKKPDW